MRWENRKLRKVAIRSTNDHGRYIDFGLELRVVQQDEKGIDVLFGCPRVRVLRSHWVGGIVDIRQRKIVAEVQSDEYLKVYKGKPKVWHVSEPQARLLLHADDLRSRLLVYGAMGAGKTQLLAMWLVLRVIELFQYAGQRKVVLGATAPTQSRRDELVGKVKDVCKSSWFQFVARRCELLFGGCIIVEFRSTLARSADLGTPIQGQTWFAAVSDELQDSTDADADIEMRGRGAPHGIFRRLCTATAKDSLKWRHYRDGLNDALWSIERIEGTSNWTVWPIFWEQKKQTLSEREYRMKVLALDVGPERAVYPSWDRTRNLACIPELGARDVTATVLASHGPNRTMLLGHDPGVLRNVTVFLKAYQLPKSTDHVWYVIDELETLQTTTEQHAYVLRDRLQQRWNVQWGDADEGQVLIRCDPWTERDSGTHRSVYTQLRQLGFHAMAADHTLKGEGRKPIPLRASVEVINRLLCSAAGKARLFLAQDLNGRAHAAKTLHSIELSQWDQWGAKEIADKGNKDKDPTDYTSALRYALWPYERTRYRSAQKHSEVLS